jgi:hypothetical protein
MKPIYTHQKPGTTHPLVELRIKHYGDASSFSAKSIRRGLPDNVVMNLNEGRMGMYARQAQRGDLHHFYPIP